VVDPHTESRANESKTDLKEMMTPPSVRHDLEEGNPGGAEAVVKSASTTTDTSVTATSFSDASIKPKPLVAQSTLERVIEEAFEIGPPVLSLNQMAVMPMASFPPPTALPTTPPPSPPRATTPQSRIEAAIAGKRTSRRQSRVVWSNIMTKLAFPSRGKQDAAVQQQQQMDVEVVKDVADTGLMHLDTLPEIRLSDFNANDVLTGTPRLEQPSTPTTTMVDESRTMAMVDESMVTAATTSTTTAAAPIFDSSAPGDTSIIAPIRSLTDGAERWQRETQSWLASMQSAGGGGGG